MEVGDCRGIVERAFAYSDALQPIAPGGAVQPIVSGGALQPVTPAGRRSPARMGRSRRFSGGASGQAHRGSKAQDGW